MKPSKLKILLSALALSMICLGNSCSTGIDFDPDFYTLNVLDVDDPQTGYIINEDGIKVFYTEEKVMEFGCMSKEKMKELAKLLHDAEMPSKVRNSAINKLYKFIDRD